MKFPIPQVIALFIVLASSRSALGEQGLSGFAELGNWCKLDASSVAIAISPKSFARAPKVLPVYTLALPTAFERKGLEWILAQCITNPATRSNIHQRLGSEADMLRRGTTTLLDSVAGRLVVSPDAGRVVFTAKVDEWRIARLTTNTSLNEAALSKAQFERNLTEMFAGLGYPAAELARKPDGQLRCWLSDTERFPNRSKQGVLVERGATFERQAEGRPLLGIAAGRIELRRWADGSWRVVSVNWPKLVTTGAQRTPPRSKDEVRQLIQKQRLLWDHSNPDGPDEASEVRLIDMRFGHFQSRDFSEIVPVVLFDIEYRAKRENQDGVLIAPLVD
jgi:hypothetical protein